jgi:HK97 family phage major capsid protein
VERASGVEAPQVMKRTATDVDVSRASRSEIRDAALAILDRDGKHLASRNGDHVEALLRTRSQITDGGQIAKRMVLTESDAYRSAFMKGVTQVSPAFTSEEARALDEFRAMSEGVDTAGCFGIPVLIDPTIILTSGAAAAPVLELARVVTITTDEWKGVSSAGVTWSYDGEGTEVSDDAPTLAQPTVPVYSARGFIPYSVEVGDDYPAFAAEMRRLLDAGYIDLVAQQTITGSGSAPQGIFTALDANTNVEVSVSTDTQLNVRSITRRNIASSSPASTRASVNTSEMRVAMSGSIIPTPLATPTTRAPEPSMRVSASLWTVSVVMIPRATDSASSSGRGEGIEARPARIRSMG